MSGGRRRAVTASLASGALALGAAGYAMAGLRDAPSTEGRDPPIRIVTAVGLPVPRTDGDVSFESALLKRRAVRDFVDEPLTLGQLGQLLWAAQGEIEGGRNVPSAGALYPLEIYVAHAGGVYRYRPAGHEVVTLTDTDIREPLAEAALDQRAFETAPAVIVIAGVTERSAVKYGRRAERYVLIEAGHAGQNVLLQAAVIGIGAVPTGAFRDQRVADLFEMPDGTAPLYLIPVGVPR